VVDDEPDSVEPLFAEIKKLPDAKAFIVGFEEAEEAIESRDPHIIVLDIFRGRPTEGDAPGLSTCEHIWDKRFCPLVFYTALPERLGEDARLNHPFVKVEKKGSGSEGRVMERIREFEPHVSALNQATKEIRWALNRALREVAPRIFGNVRDGAQIQDALTRSARRRVAAAMDQELSTGGPNLKSWEHYLCPPTTLGHPLTGDIIRKRTGDRNDPSQYAVVLTPSCDLVSAAGRRPKVSKVLVAQCKDVHRLLQELSPADRENLEERTRRLRAILTQGHGYSCLPLPALPGEFPSMAADFRDLKLIVFTDIGDVDKEYARVASVDSPFRELVAWAYVLSAARPGLPERDFDSWVEEIVAALPEPEKKV